MPGTDHDGGGTRALIPVLGDQLSASLSSLQGADKVQDRILMMEVHDETTYVRHHKKKIALILSAMRHFAAQLSADGWRVSYVRLDDEDNTGNFADEIGRHIERFKPDRVVMTEPGEWRVRQMMEALAERVDVPLRILDDTRFLCTRRAFAAWADGRKELRMEYFYREMRKKTGFLMDGGKPEGGKWNFDQENRKPASQKLDFPTPMRFTPDETTREVLDLVADRFEDHIGALDPFSFAVTTGDAKRALAHFIKTALPRFGDYQDAMLTDEPFLFHGLLSPYLNIGLLDPHDVCAAAAEAYANGDVPLNSAEGFIRQIIGWREYVRGIYWLKMPEYRDGNALGAERPLPEFYWTGETDMACLKAAIGQTISHAYAHHIQRLMVTGNFALIAGLDPQAVHEWYLAVYADAFEWVELPNTIGMSQFADGGVLGSKPYAASGNYINKMSNYCKGCRFDVKKRTGEEACPLNALYWDFLDRNRKVLGDNPRLGQMYATWDRMKSEDRTAVRKSAKAFLDRLN